MNDPHLEQVREWELHLRKLIADHGYTLHNGIEPFIADLKGVINQLARERAVEAKIAENQRFIKIYETVLRVSPNSFEYQNGQHAAWNDAITDHTERIEQLRHPQADKEAQSE
jgi:hypothetical protein